MYKISPRTSLKKYKKEGSFVITCLDKLARTTLDLCRISLENKQVDLKVIDQNIDTSAATRHLMFNILGAIGQFEIKI